MHLFLAALLLSAAVRTPGVKETPPSGAVVLVVPFSTGDGVADWEGFAAAQLVSDLVTQSPQGAFVSLKQLDAVLRRKDLQMYDAADPEVALQVARSLGATDVITGEVSRTGATTHVVATRSVLPGGKVSRTLQLDAADLPAASVEVAKALVDASPKAGPFTRSAATLEHVARCWSELVRYPLQPKSGNPPPLENADAVDAQCTAASDVPLARAGHAVVLALKGQTQDALALAKAARAKDRFVDAAYVAEAFAARRAGDVKGARTALEAGLKERPGFLLGASYLAEERMEAEDYKGAVAVWDKLLKRAPAQPFALGQKAHALARLGYDRDALVLTQRALDIAPDDPELLIELASRQIDAKQDDRAIETLHRAMEARPPRPLAWLRLAYVYIRQHKAQDAHDALVEAVTYAYREDEARTRGLAFADLAVVAGMEGKLKDAVEYLGAAKNEGVKRMPCDAPELQQFRGKSDFDAQCPVAAK